MNNIFEIKGKFGKYIYNCADKEEKLLKGRKSYHFFKGHRKCDPDSVFLIQSLPYPAYSGSYVTSLSVCLDKWIAIKLSTGLVQVIDYGYCGKAFCVVMEFGHGGSSFVRLSDYLETNQKLSNFLSQMVMNHVKDGLRDLRTAGIFYRDFGIANILLELEGSEVVGSRICYSTAILDDEEGKVQTVRGTPSNFAPEVIKMMAKTYHLKEILSKIGNVGEFGCDARADLWSIGCVFYELITGEHPFARVGNITLNRAMMGSILFKEVELEEEDLHPLLKDLVLGLLKKDVDERITFSDFFTHPFFQAKEDPDLKERSLYVLTMEGGQYALPMRGVGLTAMKFLLFG